MTGNVEGSCVTGKLEGLDEGDVEVGKLFGDVVGALGSKVEGVWVGLIGDVGRNV